jgi:uncharacterized membrane protein SpoIIM required for sporulation
MYCTFFFYYYGSSAGGCLSKIALHFCRFLSFVLLSFGKGILEIFCIFLSADNSGLVYPLEDNTY